MLSRREGSVRTVYIQVCDCARRGRRCENGWLRETEVATLLRPPLRARSERQGQRRCGWVSKAEVQTTTKTTAAAAMRISLSLFLLRCSTPLPSSSTPPAFQVHPALPLLSSRLLLLPSAPCCSHSGLSLGLPVHARCRNALHQAVLRGYSHSALWPCNRPMRRRCRAELS